MAQPEVKWTEEFSDEIVRLRERDRLTYLEIGARYGKNVNRARQWYMRARRSKRYWLTHDLDAAGRTIDRVTRERVWARERVRNAAAKAGASYDHGRSA